MPTLKLTTKVPLECQSCKTSIQEVTLVSQNGKTIAKYECPKCQKLFQQPVTLGVAVEVEKKEPPKKQSKVFAKVTGVTFANPDGTKRQDILRHVVAGDELRIEEGTFNDKTVTLLRHSLGVIGMLRSEYLTEFKALYPNAKPSAKVVRVTGGSGDKESFGCNVALEPMSENKEEAVPRPRVVYLGPDNQLFHVERHCSGLSDTVAVDIIRNRSGLKGAKACKRCAAKLFPEFT